MFNNSNYYDNEQNYNYLENKYYNSLLIPKPNNPNIKSMNITINFKTNQFISKPMI